MNVSLPDSLKSFVDEQVARRGYATGSEYVRELIRIDQDRQRLRGLLLEGASRLRRWLPTMPFSTDLGIGCGKRNLSEWKNRSFSARLRSGTSERWSTTTSGRPVPTLRSVSSTRFNRLLKRSPRTPALGSPRYASELALPGLRSLATKGFPYLVFYIDRDDHIDVWRVLHARRDIPSRMREPEA